MQTYDSSVKVKGVLFYSTEGCVDYQVDHILTIKSIILLISLLTFFHLVRNYIYRFSLIVM